MGKNLGVKTGIILAVLLFFIYGIIGIPHGGLRQSLARRINLGLDLKGGTHLVLEVHVAEALASATDRDAARLQSDLDKAGITGTTVGKTDPRASRDHRRHRRARGQTRRRALAHGRPGLRQLRRRLRPQRRPHPRHEAGRHSRPRHPHPRHLDRDHPRAHRQARCLPSRSSSATASATTRFWSQLPGVDDPGTRGRHHPVHREARDPRRRR